MTGRRWTGTRGTTAVLVVAAAMLVALVSAVPAVDAAPAQGAPTGPPPGTSSPPATPAATEAAAQGALPPPGLPALPRGAEATTEATGPAPEVVLGSDDRQRVNHPRSSPHGAIGQMYSSMGGRSVPCTGFLVYADTVATAAHCLYNKRTHRKASYVVFRPAVMPGSTGGFFTCQTSNPDNIRVPQAFIDSPSENDEDDDIGVIKVWCSDGTNNHVNVLDYTGWLGFTPIDRTNELVRLAGYPTNVRSASTEDIMYFDTGRIQATRSQLLYYNMDATEGQSGAPVFDRIAAPTAPVTGWYVLAIHSGGGRDWPDPRQFNWGARLSGQNFQLLYNWCLRPVRPG